jgi:hypothetical protein
MSRQYGEHSKSVYSVAEETTCQYVPPSESNRLTSTGRYKSLSKGIKGGGSYLTLGEAYGDESTQNVSAQNVPLMLGGEQEGGVCDEMEGEGGICD